MIDFLSTCVSAGLKILALTAIVFVIILIVSVIKDLIKK